MSFHFLMVHKYMANNKIIIWASEFAFYLCGFISDVNCCNKFYLIRTVVFCIKRVCYVTGNGKRFVETNCLQLSILLYYFYRVYKNPPPKFYPLQTNSTPNLTPYFLRYTSVLYSWNFKYFHNFHSSALLHSFCSNCSTIAV